MSIDLQIQNEALERKRSLSNYHVFFSKDPNLEKLVNVVTHQAASRAMNAGYSGSHGDDGAGALMQELRGFLDGVTYGKTGEMPGKFGKLLAEIKVKEDPEYQHFLKLREKFKDFE